MLRTITDWQLSLLISHHRVNAQAWLDDQGIEVALHDYETVTQGGEIGTGELVAGVWADVIVCRGEPDRVTWSSRWRYWNTRMLALAVSLREGRRIAAGDISGSLVDLEDYRP